MYLFSLIKLTGPALFAAFLVVFTLLPMPIAGWSSYIPMVSVIMVYFWTIYRPQVMPQWFIFALGLFQDALYGSYMDSEGLLPIGTTSLMLILLRAAVISQQRLFIRETFFVVWTGFLLFSLLATSIGWLVFMLLAGKFVLPYDALTGWIISVISYPFFHWICTRIYLNLPEIEFHA